MKFVVFGLTITSSWGNGHATLLRALFRALIRRGHSIVFFERDVPYYAANRDLISFDGVTLHLSSEWKSASAIAREELHDADVAIVTSYCFDGVAASDCVLDSMAALRVFYDLDTPITLARFRAGENLSYIGPRGLRDFDLVLSYTGGSALDQLTTELHASSVAPLYGSVDPNVHRRVAACSHYSSDLSYIGTYAEDRQGMLQKLFIEPAARLPDRKFVIAGASYPSQFPWTPNIYFVRHLPPQEHAAFFSSSRLTLNVTRASMAQMGYCPSGRLFEAAASGTPILSDNWEGLDQFFAPGSEILSAVSSSEAIGAISLSDQELSRIASAARERVLSCHTADHRAVELENILDSASSKRPVRASIASGEEARA